MTVRNDLDQYETNADAWWDPEDRWFRSLRSVGRFHLGRLRDEWGADLAGARVVDLGSGGGFLALELATLGASVVGVERSPSSVRAAEGEARRRGSSARFLEADLYDVPLPSASFDLAVMSDVLEHLERPQDALREAARLLRPGGRLFLNTFDRTWASGLFVVHLAEGLGLVPRGTHDPRLFVRPEELRDLAARTGLVVDHVERERPALWRTLRTWSVHLVDAEHGPGYSAFLRRVAGR